MRNVKLNFRESKRAIKRCFGNFSISDFKNSDRFSKVEMSNAVKSWAKIKINQLTEEDKTEYPSHFRKDIPRRRPTYYKYREPCELKPPEEAPYQHTTFVPNNDTSTQLYKHFKQSSTPGYIIALQEQPQQQFVPGSAQPYLLSHARLYSNHYQRLAPERELGESASMIATYVILGLLIAVQFIPFIAHYTQPETAGQMLV